MAPKKPRNLAEQLADLENPAPQDFDPETDPVDPSDSDEASDADIDDGAAAREHYVDVGKSKLRKRDQVPLGPRYEGSRVSRDAALEDDEDDEDDPFSKGFDEENSEVEEGEPGAEEDDDMSDEEEAEGKLDGSAEDDEEGQDGDDTSATDMSDDDEEPMRPYKDNSADAAELRRLMAEEQKSVAANLSQAAKADAEKGRAVKRQRTTFDALLNTRIKLQKALVGVNTLSGLAKQEEKAQHPDDAFLAAETAAFSLWNSLNSLRESLQSARTRGKKRTHADFSLDTPTSTLWSHILDQESSARPHRTAVLEKWSDKARGVAVIAPRNRLNNSASRTTIVDVLNEQLSDPSARLVKRTRTPRSCAPLQLSRKVTEDAEIYDDADFYGMLLQSLLEQRSADGVNAATASNIDVLNGFQMRREAKTKKNVDVKASKGRKLRYTVHEKLQNFMAPEDRGSWGGRQVDELFGSLFGRRMGLGEEEDEEMVDGNGEVDEEEAGLRLFRN